MVYAGTGAPVSKLADQEYLLNDQYKDPSRFNARASLHARFSVNLHGWLRWAFDQLDLPDTCRILEIGCGPAYLWVENQDRIPAGWHITLSDFSPGMLATAQTNLQSGAHPFQFQIIDAQAIPFVDASFDAIIANHMLYHVPDRERTYAEIKRVLRPGGRFFAATNGAAHLRELDHITRGFDQQLAPWNGRLPLSFQLENGGEELARWFEHVELRRYDDALVVPEAEPIVAFVLSMADANEINEGQRAAFVEYVAQHIAENGPLHITKDTGLFLAQRKQNDNAN
jgi:ubiquinone/menaquinone biosynthesis C-methylase UbiE